MEEMKMKHVTEMYGSPCNDVTCSEEEFEILKKAFAQVGVAVRMMTLDGATREVTFQIFNPYQYVADEAMDKEAREQFDTFNRN